MAITKEQIFAIADALDAAGQKPTLASVRKHLGGGSFTTISEAMTEWRTQQAHQASQHHEPPPQAVLQKIGAAMSEVWAVAVDMANNRLAAEREALDVARADAEAARQEAVTLADQLTAELDAANARIAEMASAAAGTKHHLETVRGELAASHERAATAEARVSEIRLQLDRAQKDTHTAQAAHEHARQETAHAREEVAALRGRLEAMETFLKKPKQ